MPETMREKLSLKSTSESLQKALRSGYLRATRLQETVGSKRLRFSPYSDTSGFAYVMKKQPVASLREALSRDHAP